MSSSSSSSSSLSSSDSNFLPTQEKIKNQKNQKNNVQNNVARELKGLITKMTFQMQAIVQKPTKTREIRKETMKLNHLS